MIPVFLIVLSGAAFLIYTGQYYHADGAAQSALKSDEAVTVIQTDYGWMFDGTSTENALIFYPGGKVEETAYAPLLHRLAGQGMDVCLVRMPFHLAVFGVNKARQVMDQYDYAHWYISGHSLGGAMAAGYAAAHGPELSGVIMLAAYPTKPLDEQTRAIMIYGSEDGVLNRTRLEEAKQNLTDNLRMDIIEGGNHAQFGNYGAQNGDGTAAIPSEEQQRQTVAFILQNI